VWRGERPDRIPYTSYGFFLDRYQDTDGFRRLVADGLGLLRGFSPFRLAHDGVEWGDSTENGIRRVSMRTPVGEVVQTFRSGWHDTYYLKTADDYRVMTWVWEHTRVIPRLTEMAADLAQCKPWDVPVCAVGRTPLQVMLVDYAGLESFGVHLFEYEAEVRALYAAMLRVFSQSFPIAMESPCTYLMCLENFTAETLGPARYAEFLLPVYQEFFPLAARHRKVVGVHYDGQTRVVRELVRESPIDVIESLTPPPEGDQTMAEARAAWPDKMFWANVNVGAYSLPPAGLKTYVQQMVRDASPDGRRLALELSEDIPPNWAESMAVVQAALRDLA
jgi:hypothetical protein